MPPADPTPGVDPDVHPDPDRVAVLAHGAFPDRAKTAVGILLHKADQVGQHKIVPVVDRFGRFVRDEIRVHSRPSVVSPNAVATRSSAP